MQNVVALPEGENRRGDKAVERIRARLRELGKSQNDLATHLTRRLGRNVGAGRVSECLNGKKDWTNRELQAMAPFLEWEPAYLLDVVATAMPQSGEGKRILATDQYHGDIALRLAQDLGGGLFTLSAAEQGKIESIAALLDVPSGYALYVVSDAMDPKFVRGQLVYVDPTRPAGLHENALLVSTADEHGIRKYAIRLILGISDSHWTCKQWKPEAVQEFSRAEWPDALKIVGSRER
jgi:hypothetical protein